MKKLLLSIFASIFLFGASVADAATIGIADREMKSIPREEGTFADRINTILATTGENFSDRVKLGLLLHSDGHISINDDVKNIVYRKLREKFPKEEFAIIKATDVATLLLKNGDQKQKMLSEMTERDYVAAAKECHYDYLLVISFVHDERWNAPFMEANDGGEETVWMKIRLLNPKTGGYIYRNDFAVSGVSTKNHIRCRVKPSTVDTTIQEVLDDLSVNYNDSIQEDNSTNNTELGGAL